MVSGRAPGLTWRRGAGPIAPLSAGRKLFAERHRFAWVMLALIGFCFWDVLAGLRSFYFRDFSLFGYPLAAFLHDRFWAGELPLWNPFNNCGLPFLAQWNTMALYPGSLFYELLPLPWSVNVFCIAHLVLGGFGMRRLVWRWTQDLLAADVAGLLFACNGLALNCLMWPNNSAAWGWMPWVIAELAGAHRRSRREEALGGSAVGDGEKSQRLVTSSPTRGELARVVAVGAMQMLTGAPEVILFTWMIGAILAGWRRVLFVGMAGALAAMLAAPQLLPFVELFRQSHRTGGDFATGDWALSVPALGHLLAPLFHGSPTSQGVYLQDGQKWTSSFYVGTLTLALGFAAWRRSPGRTLLVIAIGSLALACGLLPIGLFRYPVKWVVPAVFCLTALGGLGVAARNEAVFFRRLLLGASLVTVGILVIVAAPLVPMEVIANAAIRAAALWAGVWCLRKRAAMGVLAVLALDLMTHVPWQNPTIDSALFKSAVAPAPTAVKGRSFLTLEGYNELRSQMLPDATRDFAIRRAALLQNLNLIDQQPKLDGFFSLYPMREREFRQALYLSDVPEVQPALNFLGVDRFTRPGNALAWDARTSALPLVTSGQEPALAREGQILRTVLSLNFRPLETVYLHDRAAETNPPTAHRTEASARLKSWRPQQMELEVANEKVPMMIVIAQAFDANWQATSADGRTLKTWRANYNFLAIEAPPGIKTLNLRYRSSSFEMGLAVAFGACGLVWMGRKRR